MRRFSQQFNKIPAVKFILIWILFSVVNFPAQNSLDKMQKVLASKINLTESDFTKLKKGEMVAKLLTVQDKREVAVVGITHIKTPLDYTLKHFQETMARQNKSSIIELGEFGNQPVLADLKNLSLEKVDIEDLKKCQVGKCALKLSAEWIERFQKEIDWNAPDSSEKATQLFRELIFQYLQDYLARGDSALIEYNSDKNQINLKDEHNSLFSNLLWIHDFAPEFAEYLKNFPRTELKNIRKSLNWNKLKFGLKPFITITQTFTYTTEKDGVSQIISVSKQIYASRYFDASLGLTALVKFPADDESYLLYTNHSRSSSLEGLFSQFKRDVVEREALEKLKPLLEDSKRFAEANLNRQNEPPDSMDEFSMKQWFWENFYYIGLGFVIIIILLFVLRQLITSKKI